MNWPSKCKLKSITDMYTHLCRHLCITEYGNKMGKSGKLQCYEVIYALCYSRQNTSKAYKTKAYISYTSLRFTFHKMTNFLPLPKKKKTAPANNS